MGIGIGIDMRIDDLAIDTSAVSSESLRDGEVGTRTGSSAFLIERSIVP